MKHYGMETFFVECDCYSPEHHLRLVLDEQEKEIFVDIGLNQYLGFWKRLCLGIRYIFGLEKNAMHYDCMTLDIDETINLRDKLDDFIDKCLIDDFNKKIEGKSNAN